MNINFGDITAAGLRECADGLEDRLIRCAAGTSNLPLLSDSATISEAIIAYRAEADRLDALNA